MSDYNFDDEEDEDEVHSYDEDDNEDLDEYDRNLDEGWPYPDTD